MLSNTDNYSQQYSFNYLLYAQILSYNIQMMHGSQWTLKYDEPEVENVVYHYNDTRSTVTRWSFDNDKRHVGAFPPISEAADSWSHDNV